jgi:hypothetical protein
VGHKLRTPWLRDVVVQGTRARPWMGLRMPQFGEANVGRLPEALAALEGTVPDDHVHNVALTAEKVDAGRFLVGKTAFGCISCHDLAQIPNTGTRGPDLAFMEQRVRYDWYRRWMEQPQRMQPGTRMPSVFSGGRSLVENVLGGNADAQAEAIWGYLSLGPTLPLPDGMEPPKGLVLTARDRPVLVRTFLPELGGRELTRSVAVGYPGGVGLAFDATTCRLAYAWSGNFLDVSPVWNGRGGAPAKVLGTQFWKAPPGCPVAVGDAGPPDFAALARDPAHGGATPEGKLYDGPRQLAFNGYTTDGAGWPTFRYRLQAETPAPVDVTERPEPLRSTAGVGLARHFTLDVPSRQAVWLLAGESKTEPRLYDVKGTPLSLDLKSGQAELAPAGQLLVLAQEADRVLTLAAAPEGSRWHLRRLTDGRWQALVRLPAGEEARERSLTLRVWAPYRAEPALFKELVPMK